MCSVGFDKKKTFSGQQVSNWARPWENVSYAICEQQRHRSACASAQSDQRLCCSLPRQNDTSRLYIRNFKILAGLCSWAGQFVSCLVGDSRRHIFSWRGSIIMKETIRSWWGWGWGLVGHWGHTGLVDVELWLLLVIVTGSCVHDMSHLGQNQQNGCASSKDSDQPGHPPSLTSVYTVRMKKACVLSYPLSPQRRLIRLGGCPGWSESSLGAVILLVLSWGGSYLMD